MKTFEEYLEKMGYSWNDFDRTYEMEDLIEQYADERVNQALRIHDVVGRSEQLKAFNTWFQKNGQLYEWGIDESVIDDYLKSL
jgi:hypothetical protein